MMRRIKRPSAFFALSLALAACAASPSAAPRRAGNPAAIAIQNLTESHIRSVEVSEIVESGPPPRVGRLEPLTRGATSVIQRPSGARPLSPRIRVEWVAPDGETREQILEIDGLFRAPDASGDTLLIEITESGPIARLVWGRDVNPFAVDR